MHQSLSEEDEREKPAHVLLLDQLFSFIGSNPEKAVSSQLLPPHFPLSLPPYLLLSLPSLSPFTALPSKTVTDELCHFSLA